MKIRAFAKINLTLDVVGVRGNMHEIDSVMTSVSVFDELTVTARADKQIVVTGTPDIPVEKNTAYRIAEKIVKQFGTNGVDVCITKGVPQGAGMGGSSVDAAAVAYAMAQIYGIELTALQSVCTSVGSDVWYVLNGGFGRVGGIGDALQKVPAQQTLYFVVTTFRESCSSMEVYGWFDELNRTLPPSTQAVVDCLVDGRADVCDNCSNALQAAVEVHTDYATNYLAACQKLGVRTVMTGSGSAYYVVFVDPTVADKCCADLQKCGFDSFVCHSVPCGVVEIW